MKVHDSAGEDNVTQSLEMPIQSAW